MPRHCQRSIPVRREVRRSLRKRPTIAEKRVAASQANGSLSRGPATPEGRKRIRDARTRHGFYSQAEGVALRALGEDPDDLEMIKNLHQEGVVLEHILTRQMEALEKGDEKHGRRSRDVPEKKGVSRGKSKPLKTLSH